MLVDFFNSLDPYRFFAEAHSSCYSSYPASLPVYCWVSYMVL